MPDSARRATILSWVSVTEQVRADINIAMKSSERDRATALRMVLSELQKAAKEGSDDELAVLRRERKRRLEAADQFREGGRQELADKEQSEAELIESYLPAELDDSELDATRRRRGRGDRRRRRQGHGPGDEGRDGPRRRPRGRQACVRAGPGGAGGITGPPVRKQLELDNAVAS